MFLVTAVCMGFVIVSMAEMASMYVLSLLHSDECVWTHPGCGFPTASHLFHKGTTDTLAGLQLQVGSTTGYLNSHLLNTKSSLAIWLAGCASLVGRLVLHQLHSSLAARSKV